MIEQTVKTADVTEAELAATQMAEAVGVVDEMIVGTIGDEGEVSEHGFVRFMMQMQGSKMEKPDVADAPVGSTVLLQNANGIWVFGNSKEIALHEKDGVWVTLDDGDWAFDPELMGWTDPADWKNSLELLSDEVKLVSLPTGKPTWEEAPEEAMSLVGFDGAWRFTSYKGLVDFGDSFTGLGQGELLPKVWFDDSMGEGSYIEYRNGEPTQEELNAMGKPSWDLAPEGATVLVRNSDGAWRFGSFAEVKQRTDPEGNIGWVPADLTDDEYTEMEGTWFRGAYYDVSPVEVVAEYRPTFGG